MTDMRRHRRSILGRYSRDRVAIARVLAYCDSRFDRARLPAPLAWPLPDEPHLADWRRYRREGRGRLFRTLQDRIGQLCIPIGEGVSRTEAYADVARRGKPFERRNFGGRLTLSAPDRLRIRMHRHFAGALPVLVAGNREDFITLIRALAHQGEPAPITPSVNAMMIAGFLNWERIGRYRGRWLAAGGRRADWALEMQRVDREEPERFRDRLVVIDENGYSGLTARELGLEITERKWIRCSTVIRMEHEFTHYATRRLFGSMRNNLLDEIIADFMGVTAAFGRFEARWFLRFLGLEDHPAIRATGRIHAYRGDLDDASFALLARLVVDAAAGLERISRKRYRPARRIEFFLEIAAMTLEMLAEAADRKRPARSIVRRPIAGASQGRF